jgi:hypothetical protein
VSDRKVTQLPAVQSGDEVDTSLLHLVNPLQADAAERNRKWTLSQARVYFGDFRGPASSTTNNLLAFNDGTGKVAKDSGILTSSVSTAISQASAATTDIEKLPSPFLLMGA